MAITRILQAGVEMGTLAEFNSSISFSASAAAPKSGTYSLLTNAAQGATIQRSIPSTLQIRGGFYMRHGTMTNPSGNYPRLFRIRSGSTDLVYVRLTNDITLSLVAGGVQRATYDVSSNTYYHLGFDVKMDASAGWAYIYIDGTNRMSWDGATGSSSINMLSWGMESSALTDRVANIYIDDIYVDDSSGESIPAPPPIKRFPYITPNGNGNYNGNWAGSDGNSTDNYALVDEVPASSTDYVQATASGLLESFTMTTYTLASNEGCVAVIPTVLAQRTGGTEQLILGTRYDGLDAVGSGLYPPGSYGPVFERQINQPSGDPWDSQQAAIDGVEVIIDSGGTFS